VLLLHLPGLLATLGLLALLIVLAVVFRGRIMKHLRIHHKRGPQPTVQALSAMSPGHAAVHAAGPTTPIASAGNLLAGLVSALGICAVTWFVSWYTQSAVNQSDYFTGMLVAITAIVMYVLLALGPGIYLAATSRDWRRLVYSVVFEVLFLVAFVVVYAVGIAPLLNPGNGAVDTGIINNSTPYK
jgi:hypothetical protein